MTLPIAHIYNGELGFDVRTKLNDLIDLAGGGAAPFTPGIIPFADASGFLAQDANFFWDDAANLLTSGVGLKINGATSGTVTLNTKAVAGAWTMTLPDTAGVNAYVLSTDGSGITSWVTTEIAHPWTPAMLTTVKLWLQGDSLTGATGDPINSWTDMSGLNNNATQTGSARPTVQVAHQNGLNVVRFTAASHQGFNLPNAFTAYTEGSICFVMRLVAEPTAGNASCGPFWLGSSPDDPHYSYYGDGNIYDDFACTVRQTVGNPTTSLATYHIGGFRSKSGDWRYFLNGAQFFHSTSNVVGWKTTPKIGYSGSNYLDGYIAEAVLLDEFASTADWQKLEGYLAHKWGLLAALDPTHPYKVDPPVVFSSGVAIGDAIVGATPGRVLFVGPSSTLAQNNTFTWDNTLKDLAIGGAYYVNAARALYVVPHVTENSETLKQNRHSCPVIHGFSCHELALQLDWGLSKSCYVTYSD